MKKLFLFAVATLLAFGASAQKNSRDIAKYGPGKMPFNERGEVVFSKVVSADGKTKDQLYSTARLYIAELFNSAQDVLQLEDKEGGVLIAKGNNPCPEDPKCRVWYTLRIQCRDGRYKVDIYQLSVRFEGNRTAPPSNHPAEELTDAESLKADGSTKPYGKGFCRRSVIDIATSLQRSIETGMARNAPASSEEESW